MATEIRNARIEKATISNDDHGVLTAWLHLDYGGSGQGFSGHVLYLPKTFKHSPNQPNFGGHFIFRILEIAGVTEWDRLQDKTIRARIENGLVSAIGHIINDDWFDPKKDFAEMAKQPKEE